VASLEALRQHPALAVDVNAGHLAGWLMDAAGNPLGPPRTIPLEVEGLPASTRNGRLRAAVAAVVRLAGQHGCRSIMVEDLSFADARQVGRETLGRGRRGKTFRRTVSGSPRGNSGRHWSGWPPTLACGWWPSIRPGLLSGVSATGGPCSTNQQGSRSGCRGITPRRW